MSDPSLNLPLKSTFDPAGTDAALRALRQLQQEQTKAQPKSGGGDPFQGVSQSAQQAERDTLRYASAMASAQRATGDTAGAVETMRGAMAQLTPNTIEAHQATTKLAQAQSALQKELKGGAGFAQEFGAALTSSLTSMLGPAAAAGAAIAAVSQAGELIKLGAQAEQARGAFDKLAATAGTTGESLAQALRAASAGTISDLNLQLAANRAQLLGVAHSAGEFSTLMAIARDRAQQMGISTQFAFDSLVTGLGRGSALILDNLGITLSVTEANQAYAASIGKTVSQLSEAEKKQALINAVLAQGKASLEATGGAAETTAVKLERATAAIDNAKASLGQFLALKAGPFADDLAKVANAMTGIGSAGEGFQGALDVNGRIGPLATVSGLLDGIISKVGQLSGMEVPGWAAPILASKDATVEFFASLRDGEGVFQALDDAGQATVATMQGESVAAAQSAQAAHDSAAAHAHLAEEHGVNAAAVDADAVAQAHLTSEHMVGAEAADNAARMTAQAAINSQIDAAAKDEQAAKTELAAAQANAAATEFMLLNPNMDASQAASAAAAAGLDPLIQQLIVAAIKAREARAEVAAFNAQAGIKAAQVNVGFGGRTDADELKQSQIATRTAATRAAAAKHYNDMLAAQRDRISAVGTADQKVTLAEQDLAAARSRYGANSAEAYKAETALMQARQRSEKAGRAGGRGGGGGSPKVSEAEKTAGRLEDIAHTSGNKLAEIDAQTQDKLLTIEQKYAEQRAAAARKLSEDIARSNAATNFDQQLNDFDQFQKDLSDEQKAALADREAAEAEYNAKVAQYQEEARAAAASGDADLASDILKARTEQAEREKDIAEKAAEAKRNAGKGQAAAVDREAAEAVAASKQQADTEIAIAQAKAAERAGAEQAEKDAAVAAAEDQKNKIIAAAEESASKVKGASDSQKSTVIGNLRAQADAAKSWASAIEDAASRAQSAMGGVNGPPASGAGGGGDTGGDADTGGDGGQGFRASGGKSIGRSAGGESGGSIIETIQDVVRFLSALLPTIVAHNKLIKEVRTYEHALQNTVDVIGRVVELRKTLAQPIPSLKPEVIIQMAEDAKTITEIVAQHIDPFAAKNQRLFEHILAADKAAIAVLQEIANLRSSIAGVAATPIDQALVRKLAEEATAVVEIVKGQIITANRAQSKALEEWAGIVEKSVGIISDVASLRKDLSEQASPINMALVRELATRAREIAQVVQGELVPTSEETAAGLDRYATSVGAAVSVLKDVAGLRKDLSEQADLAPIDMKQIIVLAARAKEITQIVLRQLLPATEGQAEGMQRYADTAGAAVSILKDTADLRKELSGGAIGAIDIRVIERLAGDARRITDAVVKRMLPMSEEQAKAAQRFADTEGAAVEAIKDVLELPAKMFTDYKSPSNAQINTVVRDANRIIKAVDTAARAYDTKGLEAAKLFSESLGATFGAFNDGLEFMDRLRFTELSIDPAKLAKFQHSTLMTLDALNIIAARAVKIPPGNLGALQAANAALAGTADTMIKLAAVPFGNLPQIPGALQNAPIGGGGVTVNIYNPPPDMNVALVTKQVQEGFRRSVQFRGK